MNFQHLHVHSYYSLLDGTMDIDALLHQAKRLRFRHLALTDHNALYGAVSFYRKALEVNIHPLIGAEITLSGGTNLVLLVQNKNGYENLCQLISRGNLNGGHLNFQLSLKELIPYRKGLFVLSAGQKGKIWQLLRKKQIDDAAQYCREMKRIFGDKFYLELQHFNHNDTLLNIRLRDLGHQHQIPLVATNDVHLLTPKAWALRRTLHAIDQNTLYDTVGSAGHQSQYLKSAQEMSDLFKTFPEAIDNTEHIARQCTFEFKLGKSIFPKIELPEKETGYSYFWKICFDGVKDRYHLITRELMDRLYHEVATIHELGFIDYFLIVKDIVDFCKREGIPCVGRGSAGDSLVSYLLGITHVDPLRYNLYFERFLNHERTDPPDIDLDLCWKSRDRVLKYVYDTYGSERTAMICTFNTFQLRSSIRDVARVFGFPENEIAALTKHLPHYGISKLSQALEHVPECRHILKNIDTLEQVIQLAQMIADFPRHLSIHPGGVIIAPDHICNYTPLEVAGKGIVISQYDMYSIEPLGLVKMDLLGVRSLSVITDCLHAIKKLSTHPNLQAGGTNNQQPTTNNEPVYRFSLSENRIVRKNEQSQLALKQFPFWDNEKEHLSPLDLRVIPENDPNVIALLRSGMSMGCFQTESPAMRGLLKKLRIDDMDDVIASVALIRPGAAESGMKDLYVERRAGIKEIEYTHPALEDLLRETYGGIIYQEQVMQVAVEVAGFSLAQADVLRRSMTKARKPGTLNGLREQFIKGSREKGHLTAEQADQIWQFLTNFIGYGFNKAHACTYGVIAYQTAFLKYYYPVQYMTAVLNNQGGFYSRAAYIAECRRMGIRLLPPDINDSERDFTCGGDTIRCGLMIVHELTEKSLQNMLAERTQNGAFQNYYDFMQRVKPREGEMINLIKAGALRSLSENEPEMLMRNKFFFKHRRNRNLTESLVQQVRLLPYNTWQRILNEVEILGAAISDHPLALYENKIDWSEITLSHQIEDHKGKRAQFIGWLVTHRRVTTKNKEYMKFLTLEDHHGLFEAVLFSQTYQKYGHLTNSQGPYRIAGMVQSRLPGEANLIVEHLELIQLNKGELESRLMERN